MPVLIREVQADDVPALQTLTVLAFEPIFASFAQILGENIFPPPTRIGKVCKAIWLN